MPQIDRPYTVQAKKGKRGKLHLTKEQFDQYNEKGLIGYKGIYDLIDQPKPMSKESKEIKQENEDTAKDSQPKDEAKPEPDKKPDKKDIKKKPNNPNTNK